jgi:outer membrane protein assembly factor BamD
MSRTPFARASGTGAARLCAVALIAGLAAGCAGDRREELAYVERPAELIYSEGVDQIERRRYEEAAAYFDEVERQHPYSEWARRAMMMAAYAHYEDGDYPAAIATAERYVNLYPSGQTTAYAYYLIALCHYERILDVGRDQTSTQQALNALTQVARRYPDTDYARDARLKIDLTLDHLAGKEMDVGRWYLREGHHLAAINRFRIVIDQYETTSHVPEALHRLVEAYVALGVLDEAREVAGVLGYNYPGSRWYEDTYDLLAREGMVDRVSGQALEEGEAEQRSWWGRTVGRVF